MSHSRQLARGMLWLGSATAVSRAIDALSSLAVLRMLTGPQLGLATLAATVVTFLEGFNSLGINNVLIQRATLSEREIASAWWYVLGVAVLMTGMMMLGAPLLAGVYDAPELADLVRFASYKLLFVGLASVPLALLNRELRFREVGAIMTAATALSATLTLTLAFRGAGAWAPLIGNTAHGLFQLIGTFVFGFYRPRSRFAAADVMPLARDGIKVAGAVSVGQLTRNVDYLVLGKVVGLGPLGVYRVAFDLAMSPSMVVLQVVNRTSLPIYSRIFGEGGDLPAAFTRTLRLIGLVTAPLLILAAVGGKSLFELFDKAHHADVSLVVACLCVAGWLRSLSQCTPVLLIAAAQPARALLQAVSAASLLAFAIIFGLQTWQAADPLLVTGIAWIVATVIQLGIDFTLARRSIALTSASWLRATAVPAAVALATGAAALAVRQLAGVTEPPLAALGIDAAVIAVVFALLLRFGLGIRGFGELRAKEPTA